MADFSDTSSWPANHAETQGHLPGHCRPHDEWLLLTVRLDMFGFFSLKPPLTTGIKRSGVGREEGGVRGYPMGNLQKGRG